MEVDTVEDFEADYTQERLRAIEGKLAASRENRKQITGRSGRWIRDISMCLDACDCCAVNASVAMDFFYVIYDRRPKSQKRVQAPVVLYHQI